MVLKYIFNVLLSFAVLLSHAKCYSLCFSFSLGRIISHFVHFEIEEMIVVHCYLFLLHSFRFLGLRTSQKNQMHGRHMSCVALQYK